MKKMLLILVALFFLSLVTAGGGLYVVFMWASQDLPSFKKIQEYNPPLVTTVYARTGEVLGYFYKEKRFLVRIEDIPPIVTKSFLAAEDSGFYEHEGVDMTAIIRASLKNLRAGGVVQGASTITQQVIKSLLLTPERSLKRKLREAILAYRLERYLTKDEILTIYMNQIYLGGGAYGVEAAARTYFGCHVQDLTIAQAALLAGLPKAPTKFSPMHDPDAARNRQHYVLSRLQELGWISKADYQKAMDEPLVYKSMPDPSWTKGAYYLEEVRRWLVEKFDEDKVYNGGLQVVAAIDLKHEAAAEAAMRKGLVEAGKRHGWQGPIKKLSQADYKNFLTEEAPQNIDSLQPGDWVKVLVDTADPKGVKVRFGTKEGWIDARSMSWARALNPRAVGDSRRVLQPGDVVWASVETKSDKGWTLALEQEPKVEGALVSIDPKTGEVLAMVGGYSFSRSQFNRATQARRQPGSSFKPIVYSTAMDNGLTPASIILDAPFVYADNSTEKVWRPENFEGIFYGPTLLRTALVKSRNLVTIRVAQRIGIRNVIERARALGLDANFQENLALSLGAVEVTPINLCQAYTAFARGDGSYVKPRLVMSVKNSWGDDLFKSDTEAVPAISPQNAYIMDFLMQEVVRDGTGAKAKALGRPVAGKTGTTNDEQDAWFMGFTPYLVTGVWVGYDQVQSMGRAETGAHAALPIWLDYRKVVESQYPVQDFVMPQGITMVRIDARTGMLAGPSSGETYFLPFKTGTQPTMIATPEPQMDPYQTEGGSSASPAPGGSGATGEDLLKQVF